MSFYVLSHAIDIEATYVDWYECSITIHNNVHFSTHGQQSSVENNIFMNTYGQQSDAVTTGASHANNTGAFVSASFGGLFNVNFNRGLTLPNNVHVATSVQQPTAANNIFRNTDAYNSHVVTTGARHINTTGTHPCELSS